MTRSTAKELQQQNASKNSISETERVKNGGPFHVNSHTFFPSYLRFSLNFADS